MKEYSNKKSFYIRKFIFHTFFPLVLGIATWFDYISQSSHFYYVGSFLLGAKYCIQNILEFIFSATCEHIIIKKDKIYSIKKIFKLHYSTWATFDYIVKGCRMFGIDCPILIPEDVVDKFGSFDTDDSTSIYTTLDKMKAYHPTKYTLVPMDEHIDSDTIIYASDDKDIEALKEEIFD